MANGEKVQSYGFEYVANLQFTSNWRIHGAYSFLRLIADASTLIPGDPRNQAFVQSSWDLGHNWELDTILRYVDGIPREGVSSYNVADVRIAWSPTKHFELAVVGRDLLDQEHLEAFVGPDFLGGLSTEVQRSVYGQATLRY